MKTGFLPYMQVEMYKLFIAISEKTKNFFLIIFIDFELQEVELTEPYKNLLYFVPFSIFNALSWCRHLEVSVEIFPQCLFRSRSKFKRVSVVHTCTSLLSSFHFDSD
jgi:hypothetical protein